ncbi:hypothetical protein KC980_01550 [candidate division WWE3 bacterium]|uniref:Uncharacterized protein n=1 Tax=candidate division WWE3 bacterium TaxID=2053526 RepID=A0A955EC17_UNCKA|nr:hypothetical protein [candidate division WWE3 bacterium]
MQNLQKLFDINKGTYGEPIKDRGGMYSKQLNVWVKEDLQELVQSLDAKEQGYIDCLAAIALAVGQIHKKQLEDGQNHVTWPKEFFEQDGVEKFTQAIKSFPQIGDPFAVVSDKFTITPYSRQYAEHLTDFVKAAYKASEYTEDFATPLAPYLKQLVKTFSFNSNKESDLEDMRATDTAWVNTKAEAKYLIFAEPTEVYQDPLRPLLGGNNSVLKIAGEYEAKQGLDFWKNMFEFRLMVKQDSQVSLKEMQDLRDTSKKLFMDQNYKPVPVSLEFRELYFAAGQGAYPAKTAKNYPNFLDIRKDVGYKNTLYTNMLEQALVLEIVPNLEKAFGILNKQPQELMRGRVLAVLAHEENHPFKRMEATTLEELKATVNGLNALIESPTFLEQDIKDAFLVDIGGALEVHIKMRNAKNEGDINKQNALEAYYVADTIFVNYFAQAGVLKTDNTEKITQIDFTNLEAGAKGLMCLLEDVRTGKTTAEQVYKEYKKEDIWEKFNV